MEPCTMPSLGAKSVPASRCGCARTTVPVEVRGRENAFESNSAFFAPAPEGISPMVPLMAVALAAFVFARQRRPSEIVRLYLARPSERMERAPRGLPRLELSDGERRFLARVHGAAERLRGLVRGRPPEPAPAVVYSQPRLRNQ